MGIYLSIMILAFGITIGSFLNVCIHRIPKQQSIAYPPSHCTNCGSKLKWYDLVPVLSYIILKGRCRYCKQNISMRYPILEFVTSLLYFLLYVKFGIGIVFIKYTVFISIMIVIGMIDFDTTDVYFKTIVIGIVTSIIFLLIHYYSGELIVDYIYGGIAGAGILSFIIVITKGGMGWGDMEICLVCGLFLGVELTFVMLFFSFIIGAVIGMILILSGVKSRKDYIPFGPFIVMASVITVFWGQNILNLYI